MKGVQIIIFIVVFGQVHLNETYFTDLAQNTTNNHESGNLSFKGTLKDEEAGSELVERQQRVNVQTFKSAPQQNNGSMIQLPSNNNTRRNDGGAQLNHFQDGISVSDRYLDIDFKKSETRNNRGFDNGNLYKLHKKQNEPYRQDKSMVVIGIPIEALRVLKSASKDHTGLGDTPYSTINSQDGLLENSGRFENDYDPLNDYEGFQGPDEDEKFSVNQPVFYGNNDERLPNNLQIKHTLSKVTNPINPLFVEQKKHPDFYNGNQGTNEETLNRNPNGYKQPLTLIKEPGSPSKLKYTGAQGSYVSYVTDNNQANTEKLQNDPEYQGIQKSPPRLIFIGNGRFSDHGEKAHYTNLNQNVKNVQNHNLFRSHKPSQQPNIRRPASSTSHRINNPDAPRSYKLIDANQKGFAHQPEHYTNQKKVRENYQVKIKNGNRQTSFSHGVNYNNLNHPGRLSKQPQYGNHNNINYENSNYPQESRIPNYQGPRLTIHQGAGTSGYNTYHNSGGKFGHKIVLAGPTHYGPHSHRPSKAFVITKEVHSKPAGSYHNPPGGGYLTITGPSIIPIGGSAGDYYDPFPDSEGLGLEDYTYGLGIDPLNEFDDIDGGSKGIGFTSGFGLSKGITITFSTGGPRKGHGYHKGLGGTIGIYKKHQAPSYRMQGAPLTYKKIHTYSPERGRNHNYHETPGVSHVKPQGHNGAVQLIPTYNNGGYNDAQLFPQKPTGGYNGAQEVYQGNHGRSNDVHPFPQGPNGGYNGVQPVPQRPNGQYNNAHLVSQEPNDAYNGAQPVPEGPIGGYNVENQFSQELNGRYNGAQPVPEGPNGGYNGIHLVPVDLKIGYSDSNPVHEGTSENYKGKNTVLQNNDKKVDSITAVYQRHNHEYHKENEAQDSSKKEYNVENVPDNPPNHRNGNDVIQKSYRKFNTSNSDSQSYELQFEGSNPVSQGLNGGPNPFLQDQNGEASVTNTVSRVQDIRSNGSGPVFQGHNKGYDGPKHMSQKQNARGRTSNNAYQSHKKQNGAFNSLPQQQSSLYRNINRNQQDQNKENNDQNRNGYLKPLYGGVSDVNPHGQKTGYISISNNDPEKSDNEHYGGSNISNLYNSEDSGSKSFLLGQNNQHSSSSTIRQIENGAGTKLKPVVKIHSEGHGRSNPAFLHQYRENFGSSSVSLLGQTAPHSRTNSFHQNENDESSDTNRNIPQPIHHIFDSVKSNKHIFVKPSIDRSDLQKSESYRHSTNREGRSDVKTQNLEERDKNISSKPENHEKITRNDYPAEFVRGRIDVLERQNLSEVETTKGYSSSISNSFGKQNPPVLERQLSPVSRIIAKDQAKTESETESGLSSNFSNHKDSDVGEDLLTKETQEQNDRKAFLGREGKTVVPDTNKIQRRIKINTTHVSGENIIPKNNLKSHGYKDNSAGSSNSNAFHVVPESEIIKYVKETSAQKGGPNKQNNANQSIDEKNMPSRNYTSARTSGQEDKEGITNISDTQQEDGSFQEIISDLSSQSSVFTSSASDILIPAKENTRSNILLRKENEVKGDNNVVDSNNIRSPSGFVTADYFMNDKNKSTESQTSTKQKLHYFVFDPQEPSKERLHPESILGHGAPLTQSPEILETETASLLKSVLNNSSDLLKNQKNNTSVPVLNNDRDSLDLNKKVRNTTNSETSTTEVTDDVAILGNYYVTKVNSEDGNIVGDTGDYTVTTANGNNELQTSSEKSIGEKSFQTFTYPSLPIVENDNGYFKNIDNENIFTPIGGPQITDVE
ncbi:uncharacterized protein LOC143230551 [Tachypleus tridentatus]|uniref:uncharacterized protein LOC143230551 n=1 Tax=Tachypleus tridentatus TaxID=6853 RepID=UPI003FD14D92